MENLIPRWEWRTFGPDLRALEARLRSVGCAKGEIQDSEEWYLLSARSDANAKLRDGLMDLKLLQEVNQVGLEQWRPVMKAAFPIQPEGLEQVCAALKLTTGSHHRDVPLTWPEFQAELRSDASEVRVVSVHKRRSRYTVDRCLAEYTELLVDGQPGATVALELEDPSEVWAAVCALGWDDFENLNYPRGLKRLLCWPNPILL